ncbi:methylmalonyl-CoA mutase [candidate division CSSED10-310 bacterium]|uniref:Methylmalonyl-CoA mutase n=1 Tax=candidate division CSSED10-310 bacterium TaxID=2855610 RepID=A0ABV6YVN1_UNCC1
MSKDEKKKNEWTHNSLDPHLQKYPERKKSFQTSSRMNVKGLYSAADVEGIDAENNIGFPGEYPFSRGIQPTMYRGRFWTMRQYAGFGSAEDTNRRYRYLLDQGQTGLSVAFDLPTQIGYDPDHVLSYGEVGKVGVSISSLADMEQLFAAIPLDRVSTSMTINSTAAILLAMYQVLGEQQGVPAAKLNGTIQNDILKEYIARGTHIYPPTPSLRIITDIFEYCQQHLPQFNTISISGYHIREAGSTAVQEIAYTLSNGIAYVTAAQARGLDVDTFAQRLSFFFNVHNNFFEEVAKFRAARRLWAEIMKERFGATLPRAMMLRFHTQTAGSSLTAQEPDNNIIRVTLQALAAILGGTQSLHTNSRDEALALPSQDSVRIALRTQQIIADESGVADTVDPLGGSYFIESLTEALYHEARHEIKKIDDLGGMIQAIEVGYVQQEIEKSAYQTQKNIEQSELIMVGVNKYVSPDDTPSFELQKLDSELQQKRISTVQELRSRRDNLKVDQALNVLKNVASSQQNIMYPIVEAVRTYATLGEISDALRAVFGEYSPYRT